MKFQNSKRFLKAFAALPKPIQAKAQKAFALFVAKPTYPYHPSLVVKKLKGLQSDVDVWEGRIDQFYRFTFNYYKDPESGEAICIFRNMGRHDIIDHAS